MADVINPAALWLDLAAARLGGRALLANDEFFAAKENLLEPGRGVFIEGKYTERGKWMDGWETRRRRGPGHDWCIIRLGAPGIVHAVTVDTHHFRGNYPESCSLDTLWAPAEPPESPAVETSDAWQEIVRRQPLDGHFENIFAVREPSRASHVRLNIMPDGGVARLRVWGEVRPDWQSLCATGESLDLAAVELGGRPLASSDQFFSDPLNLLMPGASVHMGDGWETRRRRGPGHDWVVLELGHRGILERVVVDTSHFKGNYPESCRLHGCDRPGASAAELTTDGEPWTELLPKAALGPHREHVLSHELLARRPVTHVRFRIDPDGGVARLRLFGRPVMSS